jgi:polysaccharide biosynthesis/export protein
MNAKTDIRHRFKAAVMIISLGIFGAGCYTSPMVSTPTESHDFSLRSPMQASQGKLPEYRLGFGDVLEVKFFNNEKFNDSVTVRPDGRITMERIGDIYVAGMAPSELDSVLTISYSKFIRNPEITVIVRKFGGYMFYVLGEVNKAGGYELQRSMTIMEALALAGGPNNDANLKSVLLLRSTGDKNVRAFRVDITTLTRTDHKVLNDQLYHIQARDVIYVPKTFITNVNLFLKKLFDGIGSPLQLYLQAMWWMHY